MLPSFSATAVCMGKPENITLTLEALTSIPNPNLNPIPNLNYLIPATTPSPPFSPSILCKLCLNPNPSPLMHRTAPTSTPGLSPNPTRARPEHRASPQLTPQSHSASPVTPQPTLHPSLHCSRPPSSPSLLRTLRRVAPRAPCPRSAAASRQQLLSTSANLYDLKFNRI